MRWNSLFVSILATVLLPCCDVFLSDIGGLNEQCAGNGDCMDDLVCNFGNCGEPQGLDETCDEKAQHIGPVCKDGLACINGACVPAGQEGEPCMPAYAWIGDQICEGDLHCIDGICSEAGGEGEPCIDDDDYAETGTCDAGLRCVDEICTPSAPDEVAQPNSQLSWLRCAIGSVWDGWECDYVDGLAETYYNWDEVKIACPSGFRLPSRQEMINLLDDCDSSVLSGDQGSCSSCYESEVCNAMFGNAMSSERDYWTSAIDYGSSSSSYDDRHWIVSFYDGEVKLQYPSQAQTDRVRCVH